MSQPLSPETADATFESLAQQLREGPLKQLTALQVYAEDLAERSPGDDQELLDQLQGLILLARDTLQMFHEFTADLGKLVDHVAERSMGTSPRH